MLRNKVAKQWQTPEISNARGEIIFFGIRVEGNLRYFRFMGIGDPTDRRSDTLERIKAGNL